MYDVLIIGAGPAGLQAALFTARAGLSTLVAGDTAKSALADGAKIGNAFGILGEPPGHALLANSVANVKTYGGEFSADEVVDLRKRDDGIFAGKTAMGTALEAKTVVIATGAGYVSAGIQDEQAYLGKGVHTCVACDGYYYKGKSVAVVGEGHFAAEEALELAAYTDRITIFSPGKEWTMSPDIQKALADKRVSLRKDRIVKLAAEQTVTGVGLEDGTVVPADGVFLALGTTSSIAFAQKLGVEQKDDAIAIDRDGTTNVDGVYAAGGCTGGNQQIAKSAGEGCNAAVAIIKKLRGVAQYSDQT